jgi:hypothetical protein
MLPRPSSRTSWKRLATMLPMVGVTLSLTALPGREKNTGGSTTTGSTRGPHVVLDCQRLRQRLRQPPRQPQRRPSRQPLPACYPQGGLADFVCPPKRRACPKSPQLKIRDAEAWDRDQPQCTNLARADGSALHHPEVSSTRCAVGPEHRSVSSAVRRNRGATSGTGAGRPLVRTRSRAAASARITRQDQAGFRVRSKAVFRGRRPPVGSNDDSTRKAAGRPPERCEGVSMIGLSQWAQIGRRLLGPAISSGPVKFDCWLTGVNRLTG